MSGAEQKPLRQRLALRFAAAGLATLFGLYVSEAVLRILNWPVSVSQARSDSLDARAARAAQVGIPFDLRDPLDVILDLRAQGRRAYPCSSIESYLGFGGIATTAEEPLETKGVINAVVKVGGVRVLPLSHPSKTLLVSDDNENGYYPVFVTDERGFRNPPGIWQIDQADIVGLGDSFVEGCEVRENESFMSRIRERYPRTVNLGLGGGSPLTALATLREYGGLLRPRVVLWCYYSGNDYQDAAAHVRSPILKAYLNDDGFTQNLATRQAEMDSAIRDFLEWEVQACLRLRRDPSIGSWLSLGRLRLNLADIPRRIALSRAVEPVDALESVLLSGAKMKALVESWGGRLYFVYLPNTGTLLQPLQWYESEQFRVLRAELEARGIPVIDVATPIRDRVDCAELLPFGLPGHFNATGNRVVAEEILKRLTEDPAKPLSSSSPLTGYP
ncbi:MAG: hypothetical protein K8T26_14165 [Lentisphaerae bacterium]|nr:hypothetical protein [Lentisphaerota bacterium]